VATNQRHFLRLPATYLVKVVTEDRIIAYPHAINLSLGGILVGGEERLPVGSACGVAILLDEGGTGKRVVTRGTVVRSGDDGLAIAFTRTLEPAAKEALESLILSLAQDPKALDDLLAETNGTVRDIQ
jgi:hypothetical protein